MDAGLFPADPDHPWDRWCGAAGYRRVGRPGTVGPGRHTEYPQPDHRRRAAWLYAAFYLCGLAQALKQSGIEKGDPAYRSLVAAATDESWGRSLLTDPRARPIILRLTQTEGPAAPRESSGPSPSRLEHNSHRSH